jgi:hypothetical protein
MAHSDPFSGNNRQVNALQVKNLPEAEGENRPGDSQGPIATGGGASEIRASVPLPPEIGGRDGPEPTRFGDWEKSGRCIDF